MRIKANLIAVMVVAVLVSFGLTGAVLAQSSRAYRYNDNYMRRLFRQVETRTDRFSNLLRWIEVVWMARGGRMM